VSRPVRTSALADLQILEIDGWWRQNRDKAPDLFEQELALAFKTISLAPDAGHHVYYVVRDDLGPDLSLIE
jgi:hypothetical protein